MQVFVNLTTCDLERSQKFYEALGCTINPQFSNEDVICVIWSDTVCFMTLRHQFFASFSGRPLANPSAFTQVRTALTRESRAAVNATLAAGLAARALNRPSRRNSATCIRGRLMTPTAIFSNP